MPQRIAEPGFSINEDLSQPVLASGIALCRRESVPGLRPMLGAAWWQLEPLQVQADGIYALVTHGHWDDRRKALDRLVRLLVDER